jgi:hypothetical protein
LSSAFSCIAVTSSSVPPYSDNTTLNRRRSTTAAIFDSPEPGAIISIAPNPASPMPYSPTTLIHPYQFPTRSNISSAILITYQNHCPPSTYTLSLLKKRLAHLHTVRELLWHSRCHNPGHRLRCAAPVSRRNDVDDLQAQTVVDQLLHRYRTSRRERLPRSGAGRRRPWGVLLRTRNPHPGLAVGSATPTPPQHWSA